MHARATKKNRGRSSSSSSVVIVAGISPTFDWMSRWMTPELSLSFMFPKQDELLIWVKIEIHITTDDGGGGKQVLIA